MHAAPPCVSPRHRPLLAPALAFALLATSGVTRAQVAFTVEFEASAAGLTSPERTQITGHAVVAARRWLAELDVAGPRSIELVIGIDDSRPTANAASLTTGFVAMVEGRNMFEQGVAHELRTGVDPNGAAPDARITFNTAYLRDELWFDPDPERRTAPVPTDRTDAFSVLLHEFGHVLAYNGFNDLATGAPQPTFWSSFDRWIVPAPPLPVRFGGPSVVAGAGGAQELTTNNIFHWGNATAPLPMAPFRWREPVQFDDGRPRPQLPADTPASADRAAFGEALRGFAPLLEQLMNGVVFFRGTRYDISDLDRAALRDAGLPLIVFRDGFE